MSHTLFVDLESEKKPNRIFESYPIGTMETYHDASFHNMLLLLFVQDDDYRIFFLNSYSTVARRIICEVS